MADAFDLALTSLFADANIASNVVYTATSGATATIRAIRLNPRDNDHVGSLRVRSSAAVQVASVALDISATAFAAASLPMPMRGDTVTLDGALAYEVREVEIDRPGRMFTLTLGRGE